MMLSQKIKEMSDFIKLYDFELTCNSTYKSFIAPKIPEKQIKKIIKNFDNHIAINSIIAIYDTTLFGNYRNGFIFTSDGFYYKFLSKPMYFNYKDILNTYIVKNNLCLDIKNNAKTYQLISTLNNCALKNIIDGLIEINEKYGSTSYKSTGKVKKLDIPDEMLKKVKILIHTASVACGGVGTGLAQIPAADHVVIIPIQIGMIISLGKIFDLNITESMAKSIIASVSATITGRAMSQFLLGWIPVIGNGINTATAAGITELIGWISVKNFYERWIEDKNKGRYEGMKDGYNQASAEYEIKLKKQADEFINKIKDFKAAKEEYEKLLHEYEEYIKELEQKCIDLESINRIKNTYETLKNL